jgi:hypothetical protein
MPVKLRALRGLLLVVFDFCLSKRHSRAANSPLGQRDMDPAVVARCFIPKVKGHTPKSFQFGCHTVVFQSFVAEKSGKTDQKAVLSSMTNALPTTVIVCSRVL